MSQAKDSAYTERAKKTSAFFIDALTNPESPRYEAPWKGEGPKLGAQHNASTGKPYRGANQMGLYVASVDRGVSDPRWMTFKQIQDVGLRLKKGSKAERVFFYEKREIKEKAGDSKANVVKVDGTLSSDIKDEPKSRLIERHFNVFNGSDVEGLAPYNKKELKPVEWRHEQCEKLIAGAGVPVHHVEGNRAFYRPSTDEITVPLKEQFVSEGSYYATVLHELGHSTGHPSRLNRDMRGKFGSQDYAKEELRAEIGSMMMGERLGLPVELGQHVAYVKSWVKLLTDHPEEILKACGDAEKICEHLGVPQLEHEIVATKEKTKEQVAHIEEGKQKIEAVLEVSQQESRQVALERAHTRAVVRAQIKEQTKTREHTTEQTQATGSRKPKDKSQHLSM